jgi:hypothetical protein
VCVRCLRFFFSWSYSVRCMTRFFIVFSLSVGLGLINGYNMAVVQLKRGNETAFGFS